MAKKEVLDAAKRVQEMVSQLANYERMRQAINQKAPSKASGHDWGPSQGAAKEPVKTPLDAIGLIRKERQSAVPAEWAKGQSDTVKENALLQTDMQNRQRYRDNWSAKLKAGKAFEGEGENDAYGLFDSDGFTGMAGGKEASEWTISRDEYKQHEPIARSAIAQQMAGGGVVRDSEARAIDHRNIGHQLVRYKERYGEGPIDPMRLRHMILNPPRDVEDVEEDEDDEAPENDGSLQEIMSRILPQKVAR